MSAQCRAPSPSEPSTAAECAPPVEQRSNSLAAEEAVRDAATGSKGGLLEDAATLLATADPGDAAKDLLGLREGEADLDALEDVERALSSVGGSLGDAHEAARKATGPGAAAAVALYGEARTAVVAALKTVMRMSRLPEGVAPGSLVAAVTGALGGARSTPAQWGLALDDLGAALAPLAPAEAAALRALLPKAAAIGETTPGSWTGEQVAEGIGRVVEYAGRASTAIGYAAVLIPIGPERQVVEKFGEQVGGIAEAVSTGKTVLDAAVNVAKVVAALQDLSELDLDDRALANRQQAAAAFERLASASGALAEAVAGATGLTVLQSYGTLVKGLGDRGFFSHLIDGLDPAARAREQAAGGRGVMP